METTSIQQSDVIVAGFVKKFLSELDGLVPFDLGNNETPDLAYLLEEIHLEYIETHPKKLIPDIREALHDVEAIFNWALSHEIFDLPFNNGWLFFNKENKSSAKVKLLLAYAMLRAEENFNVSYHKEFGNHV